MEHDHYTSQGAGTLRAQRTLMVEYAWLSSTVPPAGITMPRRGVPADILRPVQEYDEAENKEATKQLSLSSKTVLAWLLCCLK